MQDGTIRISKRSSDEAREGMFVDRLIEQIQRESVIPHFASDVL